MSKRTIEQQLRSLREAGNGICVRREWVEKTRETLMMQVQNTMPIAPTPFWKHVRESVRPFAAPMRILVVIRRQALAVLSIFGLVAGGALTSVSAADNALPGDLLFSVKIAAEQTRLAFTKDKTERLKLKTEFVGRRGQEIKTIANSDMPEKQERLQEATDLVKRDLDTVKTQLTEMTTQSTPMEAANAAKLVDQKSGELMLVLKDAKENIPADIRPRIVAAEVAAVNVGVKAVQMMIDTKTNPDSKDVVTDAELKISIQQKVDGLQNNVTEVTQKLSTTVSSTLALVVPSAASSSLAQIVTAKETLVQTQQLLEENKLDQVSDKLVETSRAIATAERGVEAAIATAVPVVSSSTGAVTSTPALAATSTSTAAVSSSSTVPLVLPGPSSSTSSLKP